MPTLRQAAQQALEALETLMLERESIYETAITALREALAQPEQEPVACRFCHSEKGCWAWQCYSCGEIDDVQKPPPAAQPEPVSMRMPKVGDRVICLEDESLGTVVSLTAGGSPDITFDDGSRGTYLLSEFAELFGYVTPPAAQPAQSLDDLVAEFESTPAGTESMRQGREWLKDLQPEQEPVAYYHPHKGFYWAKPTHIAAPTVVDVPPVPLYTAPAQRPWQGLTDEEIESAISDGFARGLDDGNVSNRAVIKYVRGIEAKLKEKNT